MWTLTKLFIAGTIALFCFQSSSSNSGSVSGAAPPKSGSTVPDDKTTTAAPAQPVITVHNVCADSKDTTGSQSGTCTTVVTREEFENLVNSLNLAGQTVPPNGKKNLARTYADYLAVDAAARKAGMEDTPEFRRAMNWIRLRTVTELYRRSMHKKYDNPSPEEIDAYYQQHAEEFERVKLARILVPRENVSALNKDEFEKQAHAVADTARANLVKGADPLHVQVDAYSALGLAAPPHPDLGDRRRADLIKEEATEVFALKAGEVTHVLIEPKNYVIYKLIGRDMVPEDAAKQEISREVYEHNFKTAMQSVLNAAPAEFDEQYLTPGKASADAKAPSAPSPSPTH